MMFGNKMKFWFLLLQWCTLMNLSSSFFGFFGAPEWNNLESTYGLTLLNGDAFAKSPLTTQQAIDYGFKEFSTGCEDGTFYGHRYVQGNDTSVILMYNEDGFISGIQTAFQKANIAPASLIPWFDNNGMFVQETINGIECYTLTAYFDTTDSICVKKNGDPMKIPIGTQLSFKNGDDSIVVPMEETGTTGTQWSKQKCFPSMGMHYWWDLSYDMDCNDLLPIFIMYNKGKLSGFGWVALNKFDFSQRLELPPEFILGLFLSPPQCMSALYNYGGVTTLHFFLNTEPNKMLC